MSTLKYGCNPHQAQAAFTSNAVRIHNGAPSMINMLDALNGWQLVVELDDIFDKPSAASFKHVSPAGAALGEPLSEDLRQVYEVGDHDLSGLTTAYVRARGADPKSSFGDFVALSRPVDAATASYLGRVVSDGVIAPGFEEGTLAKLSEKKAGSFVVIESDPDYSPPLIESRQVFGVTLTQERNARRLGLADLDNVICGELREEAGRDLLLALVTLKYTQSNSVGCSLAGQMIGIGAGQQSRVDCTKLAGTKTDVWHLSRHPRVLGIDFRRGVKRKDRINWRLRFIEGDLTERERVEFAQVVVGEPPDALNPDERNDWITDLTGVALASDGHIPFRDNIDHAAKHGVSFIAQPGGSSRDDEVTDACREYDIAMVHTGLRLFHH